MKKVEFISDNHDETYIEDITLEDQYYLDLYRFNKVLEEPSFQIFKDNESNKGSCAQ